MTTPTRLLSSTRRSRSSTFPDILPVGQGVSAPAHAEDFGPVSYPVVKVDPRRAIAAAIGAVVPPCVMAFSSAPSQVVGSDTEAVERSLLKGAGGDGLQAGGLQQGDTEDERLQLGAVRG